MKCAIYLPDPSVLTVRFFDTLAEDGLVSCEAISDDADNATGIRFVLNAGTVDMNFMAGEEVEAHLNGFATWAQDNLNEENAMYVVNRIAHVRMVLGCNVEKLDEEAVGQFLSSFSMGALGMAMMDGNLLDFTGDVLTNE